MGWSDRILSLSLVGAHVRLLVAIPLFFVCESWLTPRMAAFVRGIVNSGLVPKTELMALHSEAAAIARWKDAWLPELVCLLAAAPLSFIEPPIDLAGGTVIYHPNPVTGGMTLSGGWYWIVCLTLFRFLIFRWLWHLGLWCHFLGACRDCSCGMNNESRWRRWIGIVGTRAQPIRAADPGDFGGRVPHHWLRRSL